MKKMINRFLLLYLAGFAAGILCANFMLKAKGFQTSLLPVYFAGLSDKKIISREIFGHLLWQRGSLFLFCGAVGLTAAAVPLVLAGILWFGFLAGNLMSIFLLEYGLKGILTGAACFFPQILFYIPGWFLAFFSAVEMGQKSWRRRKKTGEDYRAYIFFLSMSGVLLLLGIWMESYVNQKVLLSALQFLLR